MNRWFLFGLLVCLIYACESSRDRQDYLRFTGPTMGTSYNVTCGPTQDTTIRQEIDQLLIDINQELSTYIPSSTISQFNQKNKKVKLSTTRFFQVNLEKSAAIFEATDGYFDPTVMPLVNYWGFGYTEKRPVTRIDSPKVDSLLTFVGFDKLSWEEDLLEKNLSHLQLDFSAIAKGYAVDEVGKYLRSKGINNYLVEIGGELVAKGVNPDNKVWNVGINVPRKDAKLNELAMAIPLENMGMASSGNYRIFYQGDGYDYAHTINPKTGFPEKSDILSATVLAKTCMQADGYATAFMAMGLDKAFELAINRTDLEAVFLYTNETGELLEKATPNLQKLIKH